MRTSSQSDSGILAEPSYTPPSPLVVITAGTLTAHQIISALKRGLPMAELEALQELLGVSLDRVGSLLSIPKATMHRRKTEGRLTTEESDRVMRYARLYSRAVEVLEDSENARQWLSSKQFGLGGAVPLDFAQTEVGAREVDLLLGRIEYGVLA
jgi:putative toxin-antitoxin system antitoxin component (TIGR02293 family)